MRAEEWQQIHDLFGRAVDLPVAEQRAYVEAQAAGDSDLAARLFAMLESDRNASFLDAGAQPIADDLLLEPIRNSFGPYTPTRSLGEGGMGIVYLAEHSEWRTPVAIKVPRDAYVSADRRERFASEQRLLARLTHPAIARIYEGGTGANGTPWFAMEYVEGEPITTFAQSRNLSAEDRLVLFRQACEAVQYAHSQAIIHRDLKPSNIFVTSAGLVKLLDFGIARQMEENGARSTRTGMQMMTLAYAAPEQVRENRVSVHSDIYSLGVTLYELLTNQLPFDFGSLTPSQAGEVLSTKLPDKPSALSTLRLKRTEWADLDVLVQKALHKDVAQRYQSVDALVRDLNHFLAREPLEARPDSKRYRLRKFFERHRLPVVAVAAALIVTVSMTVYYTFNLKKARDEALAQAKREHRIQQFMTDLFEGGDAVNGPSKDLRVIDLLKTGVAKAKQFDSDPLVQGDLFNTLGTVYQSLGEYDRAGPLLQLASKRFIAATGPESKETAEALIYLGKLEEDRGDYDQAEATIRKGLAIAQKLKPPQPVDIAFHTMLLARVLLDKTRYAEALALLQSAAQVQSKLPDAHQTWSANLNLQATANVKLHRFAEAEHLTRSLIADDKQRHPVLRPEDAKDVENLGQIEEAQMHLGAAEQNYRQALQIVERWFPDKHPEVASIRHLLALVLMKEGKLDEATILARKSLVALETAYGQSHYRVAYALRLLGKIAYLHHDLQEARSNFNQEIAIYHRIGRSADIPTALANLADVNVEEKSYRTAESLYEEALRRFPTTEWVGGVAEAHSELMLGKVRILQKQFAQAEAPLLASLALWPKQPGSQEAEMRENLLALVKTYEGLHQPEQASRFRQNLAEVIP